MGEALTSPRGRLVTKRDRRTEPPEEQDAPRPKRSFLVLSNLLGDTTPVAWADRETTELTIGNIGSLGGLTPSIKVNTQIDLEIDGRKLVIPIEKLLTFNTATPTWHEAIAKQLAILRQIDTAIAVLKAVKNDPKLLVVH